MLVPMAQPLRIDFPGALSHVTSRGNGGADIYLDDEDRQTFLGHEACHEATPISLARAPQHVMQLGQNREAVFFQAHVV